MKITNKKISSHYETLQEIVRIAADYSNDVFLLKDASPKYIFDFLQSRYTREKGEILMRPAYYFSKRYFGDCDDFSIFVLAYAFQNSIPTNQIFLSLAGRTKITHVFPFFIKDGKTFGFDCLPGNQFPYVYLYPIQKAYSVEEILKNPFEPLKNNQNFSDLMIKIKRKGIDIKTKVRQKST